MWMNNERNQNSITFSDTVGIFIGLSVLLTVKNINCFYGYLKGKCTITINHFLLLAKIRLCVCVVYLYSAFTDVPACFDSRPSRDTDRPQRLSLCVAWVRKRHP